MNNENMSESREQPAQRNVEMLNVFSGERYQAAYVDFKARRFYGAHNLRKDGLPSGKAHGTRFVVEKSSYRDGSEAYHYSGQWIVAPAADPEGDALRKQLADAEAAVAAARLAIARRYAQ